MIIPIVHTEQETCIPYDYGQRLKVQEAWDIIEPAIRGAYQDWEGVQLYVDGYAIPDAFNDPFMTREHYRRRWLSRLLKVGSPLAGIIEETILKGAVLESTENNVKDFWLNYKQVLNEAIQEPAAYLSQLDQLDRQRDGVINQNIKTTLKERGLLLIGRKHIDHLKTLNWSDIEVKVM